MKMPFGKYRDLELTAVPRPYLRWLRGQEWVGEWLLRRIDTLLDSKSHSQSAGEDSVDGVANPWEKETVAPAFSVQPSGCIGQKIIGPEGRIIAWTTDEWAAQVICKLLIENEELLERKDT